LSYKKRKNNFGFIHGFPLLIYLCQRIKKEDLNKHDIAVLVKSQQPLKYLNHRVELFNDFIRRHQLQKQELEQKIDRFIDKMSQLNHLRFKSEYKNTK
jgi:hypothetical protein